MAFLVLVRWPFWWLFDFCGFFVTISERKPLLLRTLPLVKKPSSQEEWQGVGSPLRIQDEMPDGALAGKPLRMITLRKSSQV